MKWKRTTENETPMALVRDRKRHETRWMDGWIRWNGVRWAEGGRKMNSNREH